MAFYYGKIDPETYHEIAACNVLRNLIDKANEKGGHGDFANGVLHGAVIMYETQGYKITMSMDKYLSEYHCLYIITRLTVHNIGTDEVKVTEFDPQKYEITRGCY